MKLVAISNLKRIARIFLVFLSFGYFADFSSAQIRFKLNGTATWLGKVFPQADQSYRLFYETVGVMGGCPQQIQFLKYDSVGNILFHKSINSGYCNGFNDVLEYDNEFYVGGLYIENSTDTIRHSVTKLDMEGNLIWQEIYAGTLNSSQGSLFLSSVENSNLLNTALATIDTNGVNYGLHLFKTDTSGNLVWGNVYFSDANTSPMSKPILLNDGNYLVHAHVDLFPDVYSAFMKIDPQGNIIWSTSLHKQNNEYFILNRIFETDDGEFVVGGTCIDSTGNYYNSFILRCDSLMHLIDAFSFDFPCFLGWTGDNFIRLEDSSYAMIVETYDYAMAIIKLDKGLNFQWAKEYPLTLQVFKLAETPDTGFVFSAYDPDTITNINQYSLIKTDRYGNTACVTIDTVLTRKNLVFYDSLFSFSAFPFGRKLSSNATQQMGTLLINDLICFCNPRVNFDYEINGLEVDFTNTSVNISDSYWDFGDGYNDSTFSPTHLFPASGTYVVSLIVTDGICKDTLTRDVTVSDRVDLPGISLYPNPNNGQFEIVYTSASTSQIAIYNDIGQLVHKNQLTSGSGVRVTLDFSEKATGVYLLLWETDAGERSIMKFLLVK